MTGSWSTWESDVVTPMRDARFLCDKVMNLRIFPDEAGKMNLSVLDTGGGIMVVSQFTLYGDAREGRRPSYTDAAEPQMARMLYEQALQLLRPIRPRRSKRGVPGEDGSLLHEHGARHDSPGFGEAVLIPSVPCVSIPWSGDSTRHAREMPWRASRTPYRVFVSEIMLQQTSVMRVMGRGTAFLRAFPSFRRLAAPASRRSSAHGKGWATTAGRLPCARVRGGSLPSFHGRLPRTVEELVQLPGVGHATAAAVIVYTFNIPLVFIETNIRRVFLHTFFPGQEDVPDSLIIPLVEKTMDRENPREWYYALMDYGTRLAATGQEKTGIRTGGAGATRCNPGSKARFGNCGEECSRVIIERKAVSCGADRRAARTATPGSLRRCDISWTRDSCGSAGAAILSGSRQR